MTTQRDMSASPSTPALPMQERQPEAMGARVIGGSVRTGTVLKAHFADGTPSQGFGKR